MLMSKVIEKIVLSTCLSCSLSLYCIRHPVNAKLGRPASQALGKIGTNFVPGLSRKMVTMVSYFLRFIKDNFEMRIMYVYLYAYYAPVLVNVYLSGTVKGVFTRCIHSYQ